METWEGVGSWEMAEGRGEAHRKEGGVGGWLNEVKDSKDFRHWRQTLILSGNKAGFSSGVLEQDGHDSAPGTRPGSSPGLKTVDKYTTS